MSRFVLGIILILAGLSLNILLFSTPVRLIDGQISLLRVAILLVFEVAFISIGVGYVRYPKMTQKTQKKAFFLIVALGFSLALTEMILTVLTRISPLWDQLLRGTPTALFVADEQLEYRPNPDFPEHDAKGFRNRAVLTTADIVAIGDSQTYGMGVKPHQAWPQQLARISGFTVYNMAFGGYGCVEGLVLLDEAKQFHPTLIVFAMYVGNDLIDAFNAVYNLGLHPEFKSEKAIQAAISQMEQQNPILAEIQEMTLRMWQHPSIPDDTPSAGKPQPNTPLTRVKQTRLMQLFFAVERIAQNTLVNTRQRRWMAIKSGKRHNAEIYEVFESGNHKTIFTPQYRYRAMNLDDIRIAEGMSISLKALAQMNASAAKDGIGFRVLLIPTKEMAFYEALGRYAHPPSEAMRRLLEQETSIRQKTLAFLEHHTIAHMDVLPVLQDTFREGRQPFFVDADGHLNAVGHQAVAQAVHAMLNDYFD